MSNKNKFKIGVTTIFYLVIILILIVLSFFAGYTVFLSMLLALASKTFNTTVCVLGVFLIQCIGVLTLWTFKKIYKMYCNKTGFKIEK